MTTDKAGKIYLASYTLSPDFPTSAEAAFKESNIVIKDEEENLNTSPRDAYVFKIDGYLSAEVFEELHEAAKTDQVNELKKLLSRNKDGLERRDKHGRTPLHAAARYGALSAAELLLNKKANSNAKDESGNTPLQLGSIFGHNELIVLLIRHGADVETLNDLGQTPLSLASQYGNPESIKILLAGGANTDFKDADGNTPLHTAVLYRHSKNVDEILKVNPDIDAINNEGYTPLLLAVRRPDNVGVIKNLIQKGANLNITDPEGRNALLMSVGAYQKDYIPLLVSNGMDINSQDNSGNTALHYIFSNVLANELYIPLCKEFSFILLEEGADPDIQNKEGKSPMDFAVESGENELIDLLKFSKSIK